MFKSMKQKLGGASKKEPSSGPSKPTSNNDQPGSSGLKASSTSSKGVPGAAKPPAALREKPALPAITEHTFPQYYADPLPSFRDVSPAEKQYLFVQKLHMCAFTFDFSDSTKHVREKEMKRQTLLELVDYANSVSGLKRES